MEANNRERIEGRDFVKGGVYEVFSNDRYSSSFGIYFYPTSYPDNMEYEYNSRGTLSKLFKPLILKKIYDRNHENLIRSIQNLIKVRYMEKNQFLLFLIILLN